MNRIPPNYPAWINVPPPMSQSALQQRVKDFQAETDPLVRDQHVVSQVLLREFADVDQNGGHQLRTYDLRYGSGKLLGTRGCGKIQNWMPRASNSVEVLWQTVEQRLKSAIRSVDGGTIYSSANDSKVVKQAVALHYVRSAPMRLVAQDSVRPTAVSTASSMITNRRDWATQEYIKRHQRRPTNDRELRDYVVTLLLENATETIELTFRAKAEEAFDRIGVVLAGSTFDVLVAPTNCEFIIGDAPVCCVDRNSRRRTGPHKGVGIFGSAFVVMPLTPRHIIRIPGISQAYDVVDSEYADWLNSLQLRNAYRHVFAHPANSAFLSFAGENRAVWSQPPEIVLDTVIPDQSSDRRPA